MYCATTVHLIDRIVPLWVHFGTLAQANALADGFISARRT